MRTDSVEQRADRIVERIMRRQANRGLPHEIIMEDIKGLLSAHGKEALVIKIM